ncbi:hypothetical protein CAI16_13500 [Virgibacillus dokdonensis]|uniref:Uncharacterized protein n=2 Tax=Virgibacillus dokdonensis TaxID=302167 RepID=A0A3E0WPJ1_9BACI|nr:hypothetical protein CAI16_13500 [Virgibacillus dokdonensis]
MPRQESQPKQEQKQSPSKPNKKIEKAKPKKEETASSSKTQPKNEGKNKFASSAEPRSSERENSNNKLRFSEIKGKDPVVTQKNGKYIATYKDDKGRTVEKEVSKETAQKIGKEANKKPEESSKKDKDNKDKNDSKDVEKVIDNKGKVSSETEKEPGNTKVLLIAIMALIVVGTITGIIVYKRKKKVNE